MVTSLNVSKNGLDSNHQFLKLPLVPPTKLFGTDGIRGKVGELLTPELALQVGLAAGKVWRELNPHRGVVIMGQDSRNSSDMLATAMASGLTAMDLEVWNVGLCPTPGVAYLTRKTDAIGGIMISASHNPPEDNGIKFFAPDGTKLENNVTTKIEELLRSPSQNGHKGLGKKSLSWGKNYHRHCLVQEYAQFLQTSLLQQLDFQGMRIVLDLAWGAAVEIAPLIFESLGAQVISLHHQADGDRINVNCGSTHLAQLQAAVQEYQADMGFAFDGDADRAMAVDAKGRKIDGDYILYFWGKYLQQRQLLPNNLLIGTVMANLGFELAWNKLGGNLIRTPVGDQHVQAKMWQTGAMLGGEQSGHIICHHHHVSGDGIQTALQLTALVRQQGDSLAFLVEQSFQPYPQLLRNVKVEDRDRRLNWQECQPLQRAIARAETAMENQGRVLVRASGTEPVIRVMVEAKTEDLVHYWTGNLVNSVEKYLGT
jgi:phosphoglucosamine mutase